VVQPDVRRQIAKVSVRTGVGSYAALVIVEVVVFLTGSKPGLQSADPVRPNGGVVDVLRERIENGVEVAGHLRTRNLGAKPVQRSASFSLSLTLHVRGRAGSGSGLSLVLRASSPRWRGFERWSLPSR